MLGASQVDALEGQYKILLKRGEERDDEVLAVNQEHAKHVAASTRATTAEAAATADAKAATSGDELSVDALQRLEALEVGAGFDLYHYSYREGAGGADLLAPGLAARRLTWQGQD